MTTDERLTADRLSEMAGVSSLIVSSLDEREVRRRAVEAATRLLGAERASLLLVDTRANRLYFEVALGEDAGRLERVRLVPGQGIAGSVLQTCTPVIVNDVPNDPRYFPDLDARTGFTTRSMICAPLSCKGEPLGVLEVINKVDGTFDDEDLAVATMLANQIAIAVENARLYRRARRAFIEAAVYASLLAAGFIAGGALILSLGS